MRIMKYQFCIRGGKGKVLRRTRKWNRNSSARHNIGCIEKDNGRMERAMKRFIITGFNGNDRLSGRDGRTQQGGTSILVAGRASGFASMKEMDDESLGQWCYINLEQNNMLLGCAVRIILLLRPATFVVISGIVPTLTLYNGVFTDPCDYFTQQLVQQLLEWKQRGDNIILMGDFNDDVYSDALAARLGEDDLLCMSIPEGQ